MRSRDTHSNDVLDSLWTQYWADPGEERRKELLTHYLWLVKYVMRGMSIPNLSLLEEEDFYHVGVFGLYEALERYEADRGIKFETYAVPRIRGTILDEMRRYDWLSRSARKRANDFIEAGDRLRSQEGREVSNEEIRQYLNVTIEEYSEYLSAAAAALGTYAHAKASATESDESEFEEREIADTEQLNPQERIEEKEQAEFIVTYLERLPEKKRLVMILYYHESLTFKEIGSLLEITESRVCQIHTQVVKELRAQLHSVGHA